jgi:hypothetical protein
MVLVEVPHVVELDGFSVERRGVVELDPPAELESVDEAVRRDRVARGESGN